MNSINRLLATMMSLPEAPKLVYRSSTNGNTYCLSNQHDFHIAVLDYKGEIVDTFEQIFASNMLEKTSMFFKYVAAHINTGKWEL